MGGQNSKRKDGSYSSGNHNEQPINNQRKPAVPPMPAPVYWDQINAIRQRHCLLKPPSAPPVAVQSTHAKYPTTTHTKDLRNNDDKPMSKLNTPKEILGSVEIPKETVKVHLEFKNFALLMEKWTSLVLAGKVVVRNKFSFGETLGTPSKWRVFVQEKKQLDPSDFEEAKRFWSEIYGLTLKGNTKPKMTLTVPASPKGTIQNSVPATSTSAALASLTSNSILFEANFEFKASLFEYYESPGKSRTFSLPENIKEPLINLQVTSEGVLKTPKPEAGTYEQFIDHLGLDRQSDVVTFRLKRVKDAADPPVTMKVHRSVLKARSPVFQRMFQSTLQETKTGIIDLEDISPRAMEIILVYFYFSYLPPINLEGEEEGGSGLNPEWSQHFLEILNFAEKYQVDPLKRFCDILIIKICTKKNALDLIWIANLYLKLATGDLLEYIKKYLEEVIDSDSL